MAEKSWGRVDADGNVYCLTSTGERLVGAYPDVSGDEALAFFERKYADLALAISLLEQRAKRGAPASDLEANAHTLRAGVEAGYGVGDFDALRVRLDGVSSTLEKLKTDQLEATEEAIAQAVAERTAIVESIEGLAQSVGPSTNWKTMSGRVDELFAQWQEHQKAHPRFPKASANDLWKRFRNARSVIDTARRAHFAQVDARNKESKSAKESLIAKAEALASKGSAGIPAYRDLLDEWKRAPRGGKKLDDALWAKFKAAGDALYEVKARETAAEDEAFSANLALKETLLAEAEPILAMTDRAEARAALNALTKKWDAIGKVPRASMKSVDERLRKIENAVRKLEEAHWEKSNPEKAARASDFASAISDRIARLEADLAKATSAGDAHKVGELTAAIETQRAWLTVVN